MLLRKTILALLVAQVAAAELADGLYAEFDTTMGSFTCRLDQVEAPLTVANFVGLVEGSQAWLSPEGAVESGNYYDGLIFHRVIENFMIQGGDPLGTGTGGPGYAFPDQISTNLLHSSAGMLSMANSGADSNGSQFFITLEPTPWLDGKHAVFGEVVEGMDVVANIGLVPTGSGDRPSTNVVMNAVRVLRVGAVAAAFDPAAQPLPEVRPLALGMRVDGGQPYVDVGSVQGGREQAVYVSMDLENWWRGASRYRPSADEAWSLSFPSSITNAFCRAVEIRHPQAIVGLPLDESGQSFVFTNGVDEIRFSFGPYPGGSFSTPSGEGAIEGRQWRWDEYRAELRASLDNGEDYYFERGHESDLWSAELTSGGAATNLGSWSARFTPSPE